MISEKEIEELKQARAFLDSYREEYFEGLAKVEIEKTTFGVGGVVGKYNQILRPHEKLRRFMVTEELFNPRPTPEDLLKDEPPVYVVRAQDVKERLDAVIAYIDSIIPKQPEKIGFQRTPAL